MIPGLWLGLHTAIGYGALSILFVGGVDGCWLQAGPAHCLSRKYRYQVSTTTFREITITSKWILGEKRFRVLRA